jgi:uncharacterized protein (TIGR04255 family)
MPTTRSLQELVIAAHFQAPLPLSVMDLAHWVECFTKEFPVVQQLPLLPPTNLPAPGVAGVQFQFLPVDAASPRMLLRTADGRYHVQLQNDRFAFGWSRTEPIGDPAEYEGFPAHQQRWKQTLDRFEAWTDERFHQRPAHRLLELTYSNAMPLERNGRQKRLSEIFKFVQPAGRKISGFNTTWAESIYPTAEGQPPKGVVQAAVGLGVAVPAVKVLAFTFVGLALVASDEQSDDILNDIHTKIREIYEAAINPDADD